MCTLGCALFVAIKLSKQNIAGKTVLEVGSYDVNGSLRKLIESWQPAEYTGVDIQEGPSVDRVCDAEKLLDIFPEESFDVVFSTELLEHVLNPKIVISNIKRLCKRNGIILLTTRSYGFGFHPFPYDFWRFERADMEVIFSDCEITDLEEDFDFPGVFVKVEKPNDFVETDLSGLKLYNIVIDRQVTEMAVSDIPMRLRIGLAIFNAVLSTTRSFDKAFDKAYNSYWRILQLGGRRF
jgi:SAM-dependent methyltransferase